MPESHFLNFQMEPKYLFHVLEESSICLVQKTASKFINLNLSYTILKFDYFHWKVIQNYSAFTISSFGSNFSLINTFPALGIQMNILNYKKLSQYFPFNILSNILRNCALRYKISQKFSSERKSLSIIIQSPFSAVVNLKRQYLTIFIS